MSITNALKNPTTGQITLAAHTFAAGVFLVADGTITMAAFKNHINVPEAEDDLDAIAAVYLAQPSALTKHIYADKVGHCAILLQTGGITAAQFRTFMGIG